MRSVLHERPGGSSFRSTPGHLLEFALAARQVFLHDATQIGDNTRLLGVDYFVHDANHHVAHHLLQTERLLRKRQRRGIDVAPAQMP